MKNILFMGTASFSAYILETLINEKFNIIGVVTQPDKKVGRKQEIRFSEVKEVALKNNIEVFQPINIKKDFQILSGLDIDVIITAAYGQIVPQEVLDMAKIIPINVHGSLLPKYRGAAPIQYAILNGDNQTGITIMEMVKEMDAGDIIAQEKIDIYEGETSGELFIRMQELSASLLVKVLPDILNDDFTKVKQKKDMVSFAPKILKDFEHISFDNIGNNIINKINSLLPHPGGYFIFDNTRYKIKKAIFLKNSSVVNMVMEIGNDYVDIGCNDGVIRIYRLQIEGKKEMSVLELKNGNFKLEKECVVNE